MELKIAKADGNPLSSKESELLMNYLKEKFAAMAAEKADNHGCKISEGTHLVDIYVDEDDAYVYAVALVPGITKERIEVLIDGPELIIETRPAKECGTDKDEEKPFLWKRIENISYEGECELPTEVIAEEATAELSNGVLFILLPKPESMKPTSVPIV